MYSESNFWTVFWVIAIAQAVICGGLCAGLASAKNRDSMTWFLAGFFFGVLGLIAAAGMPIALTTRALNSDGGSRNQDAGKSGRSNDVVTELLPALPLAEYEGKSCKECGKQFTSISVVCRTGTDFYHRYCL